MTRTAQSSSLATPSLDTVAPKEIAAWAKPNQQGRRSKLERKPSNQRRVASTSYESDSLTAERELMAAMQEYKQSSGRMFPTWSEVLEVVKSLGYQKNA